MTADVVLLNMEMGYMARHSLSSLNTFRQFKKEDERDTMIEECVRSSATTSCNMQSVFLTFRQYCRIDKSYFNHTSNTDTAIDNL